MDSHEARQSSGQLPPETHGFVGRVQQLTQLWRQLSSSRLVTVTGIGGVGKSRIALRVAHQLRPRYRDGVRYVDLSPVRDERMLTPFVNSALGLADQSHRPSAEMLTDWTGQRQMLLVLDTCEHVLTPLAALLDKLLTGSPELTVLLTSRQPVGLRGESALVIPPFQLPYEDPSEPVHANEAVQLFLQRGASVRPDFQTGETLLAEVAELCRRLDGIPLAIELAATQLRSSRLSDLLAILPSGLHLTEPTAGDAPSRHHTLRTTIGWSHELCLPGERLLWARLSVFTGSFDLTAAQTVCSDAELAPTAIPELLQGLVDKSILLERQGPNGSRYRLVDTLREYGQEWLERLGGTRRFRNRHRDHFLDLAGQAERAWSGREQVYWTRLLEQDHHNLSGAVEHCLSTPGEGRNGLLLLSSLWFLWVACGHAPEGRLYLERALNGEPEPSRERCKALWVLSYICSAQGDISSALKAAEESYDEAILVGDPDALSHARKMQGTAALLMGDLPKAVALLGTAIHVHKNARHLNPALLPAVVEIALALSRWDEAHAAEDLLHECVQVCGERGELWLRSHAHWALATVQIFTGEIERAYENIADALRIKLEFYDVVGLLMSLEAASRVAVVQQDPLRSAILIGATEVNWRLHGLPLFGSPFFTVDHRNTVVALKEEIGEAAYDRAHRMGSSLNLAQAVTFALSNSRLEDIEQLLEQITAGHNNLLVAERPQAIKIYLSEEEGHKDVQAAVLEFADLIGLEVTHEFRAVIGSWFKHFTARFRRNAGSQDELIVKAIRAAENATLHKPQSDIDAAAADAVAKLITALANSPEAAIQCGSIFLVKDGNGIRSRHLSQVELHYLERNPSVLRRPREAMAELEQAAHLDPADASSADPSERLDMEIVRDTLKCYCGSGRGLISCCFTAPNASDPTPPPDQPGLGRN